LIVSQWIYIVVALVSGRGRTMRSIVSRPLHLQLIGVGVISSDVHALLVAVDVNHGHLMLVLFSR
jgi:hypothetical protein